MSDDLVVIRRALLSVSDKTGLTALAQALAARGVELISTGGTAAALRAAGLAVREVSDVTGSPEMLDGRVKTLHPSIHGGLLAVRDDPGHRDALAERGIETVDLLVVNLYPFEATVASDADAAICIDNIDIGGPAMLRSAAKNHRFVTVLTDVEDYAGLLAEMARHDGATTLGYRQALARTVFGRTAAYDAAVSAWMAEAASDGLPRRRTIAGRLVERLRYGENPHQTAGFYRDGSDRPGVASARQLQGKPLSYNNIADIDAAFELVAEFAPGDGAACAIIKHGNPCGVALGATMAEAYRAARDCDRTSAFGGIVALNGPLDARAARIICETFTEAVIAPQVSEGAAEIFAARKNLRLLAAGGLPDPAARGRVWRQVSGGMLVQDRDAGRLSPGDLCVVTRRAPTEAELRDLVFAWIVAKHVKSNAIVYAKGEATVGIGAGQMSRVDSTRIAASKATDMAAALGLDTVPTEGAAVASDAFFPFADGLIAAAEAGARSVIQPGGSMRDPEVIAAADAAGLAMVFTGTRHFRH